jgi:Protein of unknown function (DUF1573)
MTKSFLIPMFFYPILLVSGCGGDSVGPMAEMEATEYDFGLVRTDELSEARFTIYNKGDKTLKLYDVVTSCACTTGQLMDKQIPPGGKGELIIRVNPNKMRDASTSLSLGIKTNDPAHELLLLPVLAHLEYPLRFESEPETASDTRVIAGLFASTNGIMRLRKIPQGVPTVISIRAVQHMNRYINAEPTADQAFEFEGGEIKVSSEIGLAPFAQWADPNIKEFDLKFTFLPSVPPGDYEVVLRLNTNVRRYLFYNLTFELTVVETSEYAAPNGSQTDAIAAPEEVVTDSALHLVSILKESDTSYAARIATGSSERWYNEGAEFDGYVLEKIYSIQKSVVVREVDTGRRLRVTSTDTDSGTVTLVP